MKYLPLIALLLFTGCATSPAYDYAWRWPAGGKGAADLKQDEAACYVAWNNGGRVGEAPFMASEAAPLRMPPRYYEACLQSKGWELAGR